MTVMNLQLNFADARYLIEACRALENQWLELARDATDEDTQADYSNDSGVIGTLREHLETQAVDIFGPQVREFPREPLP